MRLLSIEKVDVEQSDINSGLRHSLDRCPTAIALNRALGDRFKVCRRWAHGSDLSVQLPASAAEFEFYFDTRKSVSPQSFYVKVYERKMEI